MIWIQCYCLVSIFSGFWQNIFLIFQKFCQIIFKGKNFLKTENFNKKQKIFLVLASIGLSPAHTTPNFSLKKLKILPKFKKKFPSLMCKNFKVMKVR